MSAKITNQNKDDIEDTLKDLDNIKGDENENESSKDNESDDELQHGNDESENDESGTESDEEENDDESQSGEEDDKGSVEVDEEKENERKDEFKQKFNEAQRQAQVEQSKNKKLNETITQASEYQPTDQELKDYARSKGVDFDGLTQFEKSMLQETYTANKRFSMVNEAVQANNKIDEWGAKIDEFSADEKILQKYPHLQGHESEFRSFAMKPSRRGADIDDLARLFSLEGKAPTKHKGSLLATGNGGTGKKPSTNNSLSDADSVAALRRSNPKEYGRLVKAGKIKVDF